MNFEYYYELFRKNDWLILFPMLIVAAYYLLKWRREAQLERKEILKTREITGDKFHQSYSEEIEYFVNETPSAPIAFGNKIRWLAIKTDDTENVVQHFTVPGKKAYKTNAEHGIYGAFAGNLYVMSPIQNWVLVVGVDIDLRSVVGYDKLMEMSRLHGEAQFFGSFRGANYSAWARFVDGEAIRVYEVADGEVYLDMGDMTDLEESLVAVELAGAQDEEERNWIQGKGKLLSISSEENVSRMAAHWSIDPQTLENYPVVGLGTIMED